MDIETRILYRDALMLVLDKPAGIPVHKGRGGGETLEDHFENLRFGLPRVPALAHRLDRDTSGCLVLGRNRHALATLGKLFAQGKIRKTYWAVVSGVPPQPEGEIDLPVEKRSSDTRNWQMQVSEHGGLPARTRYRVLCSDSHISWLELQPQTGRTHQLRVHCAAIGCPILGDRIYGAAGSAPLLHLHAQALSIPLYPKKEPVQVEAPLPEAMQPLFAQTGWRSNVIPAQAGI